ncbi:MAG: protein jag, partial [Candidatus Limnocylindrales bacterium]
DAPATPAQDDSTQSERPRSEAPRGDRPRRDDRPARAERPGRTDADRPARRSPSGDLTEREAAEVAAARGSVAAERADLEAADASPEALAAGKEILENLMRLMEFDVTVEIRAGDTSRLNVIGEGDEKEALGALIGRKGERLSALQHLVNLMLSRRMEAWTRVLVDVEDYRGRRERQLEEIARRAAERVAETGKMLQLEPMSALERRWIHIALRDNADVATQSIGEEPNRRVIVLPRA